MSIKTEAIVLYERPFREADRLYSILTPREGVLQTIIRSAGRTSSKLAGHVRPFTRIQVMIGRGKKDYIAGVTVMESFDAVRNDLATFGYASALAELVMRLQVPGQAASDEYQIVHRTLQYLNATKMVADKATILRIALWKLFTLAGWQPDFYRCSISGIVENAGDAYYLPTRGFVGQKYAERGLVIPEQLITYLQNITTIDNWQEQVADRRPKEHAGIWGQLSQVYYQDILERPLNSVRFFKYLV